MARVLAFGAHPDDVEFQCAGTLALLAQRGHEIHIAVMAGGEYGSASLSEYEIRRKRLAENAKSAKIIGARFHYAGGHDGEIQYDSWYRKITYRVLREVDPTIVFTHPPTDYMVDHEEMSRLVRNACFLAPVPNCDSQSAHETTSGVPHLYYWNAMGLVDIFGRPLPLTNVVDISSVMDVKEQMLACHESQREWLRHHHKMDAYIEEMRHNAQAQGQLVGRAAAEGFIQHLGHGYPTNDILAEMLGDLCIRLRE
ncbi:MAG: PIG-L family deacetylase [Armatimonadota bacterium]|nr:PIG-L family deacetylase [Armatimonadota bacterium]